MNAGKTTFLLLGGSKNYVKLQCMTKQISVEECTLKFAKRINPQTVANISTSVWVLFHKSTNIVDQCIVNIS